MFPLTAALATVANLLFPSSMLQSFARQAWSRSKMNVVHALKRCVGLEHRPCRQQPPLSATPIRSASLNVLLYRWLFIRKITPGSASGAARWRLYNDEITHARTYVRAQTASYLITRHSISHTGSEHSSKSECATHMLSACGRSDAFARFDGSSKAPVCSTELGTSTQYCRSVHPQLFKSCQGHHCKLSFRVLAASSTVIQEQFVFRSATSAEDLYEASVLRAEAYYEVPLPNQCLHLRPHLLGMQPH